MITCTHCQFEGNAPTAPVCSRCGAPLFSTYPQLTRHLVAPKSTNRLIMRTRHINRLSENEVALYIAEVEDPLIASVTHETILGRINRLPSLTPQPAVDLTQFQAIERGVSRAHAALRRYQEGLAVLDLNSTNGTWVNNVRLTPQQPTLLRNGDRIVLAKLSLYIFFDDPNNIPNE